MNFSEIKEHDGYFEQFLYFSQVPNPTLSIRAVKDSAGKFEGVVRSISKKGEMVDSTITKYQNHEQALEYARKKGIVYIIENWLSEVMQ